MTKRSFLAAIEVCFVYTHILVQEGLSAVDYFLPKHPSFLIETDATQWLLELTLTCNNFVFDNHHYLLIPGASMWPRVSSNFANVFMGKFEKYFVNSHSSSPTVLRYIDDIFIVWNDGEGSLLDFFSYLNCHKTIKFASSYWSTSINVLDVSVTRVNSTLTTDLYRRPTDRRQILHYDSYHHKCQKNSILYSQFLQLRRICSDDFTY